MLKNYSSTIEFYLLGFPGSKELHNILFATFFFFYSVSLIGNMVIIFMVCIDKRLQSPMYFFLGHLSVLEMLTTTVTVPLMLWGLLLPGMLVVSLTACCTQRYLYLSLGTSEFLLFTAMAVDRYVAVCNPLRYNINMNSHTCLWVVIVSWVFGFLFEIWPVYATFHLRFCKSNVLDHFYCDGGQLFKLSCDKGRFTELMLFLMSIFIPSGSHHWKTISTCASHFTCVVIGYSSSLFLYVKLNQTQAAEYNRVASLMVLVVNPFLNPFIFTLWNGKFTEVFRDVMRSCYQLLKD
ncbi:hypothetical protein FD754_018759 [Muntiacus muntjak]|uniref:G-protein coupled receptors family 1 profile domain-containing protein n=1 Tax=Muntiacus muntjak TaxID=9888 RepID=A0A5N3UYB7_MUNMU|nr:hypothetical protein FD754_018759 [Muntiacus muntjak]